MCKLICAQFSARTGAPLVLLFAGLLTACAPAASPTTTGIQTFTVPLSGTVLMLDGKPGDPDGIGSAEIAFNTDTGEICWEITPTGIRLPALAAHIHRAPVGQDGPVVVHLFPPDKEGHSKDCRVTPEVWKEILETPSNYAVLIHTGEHQPGALRGQLAP